MLKKYKYRFKNYILKLKSI